MSDYFEWDEFSDVYLEDSFVINISESDSELVFDVEFVLTEDNPLFKQPKTSEQYCYHRGRLIFSGVTAVNWKRKYFSKFYDANGEEDYGNIDVLRRSSEDTYQVSGDWGDIELVASRVKIFLETTRGHTRSRGHI